MTGILQLTMERVQDNMDDILTNFKAGAKITVLVRTPGKPTADFCLTSDTLDEVAAMIERRKAETPPPQTNMRTVAEIPMTAFADAAPQRDEFKHEQTILTYSVNVGTWDLSFFEAGEEFPEEWFGDTHWIDITGMWPGVIAQVASFAIKEAQDNDR